MVWADGLSAMWVTQCVGDVGRAVAGFYCLVRWLLLLLPWMDIGMNQFRYLWTKYVDYDNSYIQQCNFAPP